MTRSQQKIEVRCFPPRQAIDDEVNNVVHPAAHGYCCPRKAIQMKR